VLDEENVPYESDSDMKKRKPGIINIKDEDKPM